MLQLEFNFDNVSETEHLMGLVLKKITSYDRRFRRLFSETNDLKKMMLAQNDRLVELELNEKRKSKIEQFDLYTDYENYKIT